MKLVFKDGTFVPSEPVTGLKQGEECEVVFSKSPFFDLEALDAKVDKLRQSLHEGMSELEIEKFNKELDQI